MSSGTTFGSTVTYTCRPGYKRVGDRTITCLANGQWSASAPVCNREQFLAASSTYFTHTVKEHAGSVIPEHNIVCYS